MKKTIFKYPQFRARLILIVGPDLSIRQLYKRFRTTNKEFREQMDPDDDGLNTTVALTCRVERTVYLFMGKDSCLSDLHHECIHIVSSLFYLTDTHFTEDTEETFAYTSTMVFEQLLKVLTGKHKLWSKSN